MSKATLTEVQAEAIAHATAAALVAAGSALRDPSQLVSALTGERSPGADDVAALSTWLGEAALGARADDAPADQPVGFQQLLVGDLLLVWAATHGDEGAIRLLHERARYAASRINRRLLTGPDADDVLQRIWLRFLEDPSLLLRYQGRGSLEGWFRVILTREALSLRRRKLRAEPLGDDDVIDLPGFTDTPELRAAKKEHRELVQAAIGAAMRNLEEAERDLVSAFYLAGATIDELGEQLGVHRSTVSKRLRRIRERLLADATARVKDEQSRLSQSVFGFVMSQVEISIGAALGEPEPGGG